MESLSKQYNFYICIWVLLLWLRHVYLDHAFRGVTNIFVGLNRDEDIHAVFRTPAILPFELLTLF